MGTSRHLRGLCEVCSDLSHKLPIYCPPSAAGRRLHSPLADLSGVGCRSLSRTGTMCTLPSSGGM